MIKRFLLLLLTICSLLVIKSCTTDKKYTSNELKEKIKEFGKDNSISQDEWDELVNDINAHFGERSLHRFFTNDLFDEEKLAKHIEDLGFIIEKETNDASEKIVNIYIENSGSMFGFVTGNTDFKNALVQLISSLKSKGYHEKNINFHFVNKKITKQKINGNLVNYPINLTANTLADKDKDESNLNDIFKQVLDSTKNNTISILFSDCIYSVYKDVKNNDIIGALKIWQTKTSDVFSDAIRNKGGSTLFVQLTSSFTGEYYPWNKPLGPGIRLTKKEIPYYITIIGEEKDLSKFDFIESLMGYQNKSSFSTHNYSNNIFYSLIRTKEDNGRYKPARTRDSNPNTVKSIEDISIDKGRKKPFIFSLAVDFSELPIDTRYLQQKNNYRISKGNYEIINILPFDKNIIDNNVKVRLEKNKKRPTHIIVFESTSNNYSDLEFSLIKSVPQWIEDSNTEDDSNIKENPNQTFGIKYLAQGIFDAYQNASPNKNYITFTINIKK